MNNESTQSKGIGFFFMAAIPCVLGLAAATWLGVVVSDHDFSRQTSQEHRAADAVGEKTLPKAPLKIEIRNDPHRCVKVEDAHFDGDDLWVYTRRLCGSSQDYTEMHWREVAADGTVVRAGWTNNGFDDMDIGQRTEYKPYDFQIDPRPHC